MLTILSVRYGSHPWLAVNAELCAKLNPAAEFEWIVVDNGPSALAAPCNPRFRLVPGAAQVLKGDRGSHHHAAGLMLGLNQVTTRYLLVLDPDFFVVRPGWIERLVAHMAHQELSFFGSVWHPRWSYQYRYFPSVHFMMVDLERVPVSALDFTPDIKASRWDRLIGDRRFPLPEAWRELLQVGQFRDTGSRIARRYRSSGHRFECLVPHFDLEAELAAMPRLHRVAARFFPDALSPIPRRPGSFTNESFLRFWAPAGYARGWEEFFWRGQPFAFHLRAVGRGASKSRADEAEVRRALRRYGLGRAESDTLQTRIA